MTKTMIRHFNKFFSRVCTKDDVNKAKKVFRHLAKNSYLFVNQEFDEQTILTLAIENRHNELAIKNALIILKVLKKKDIRFIKTEQEVHQEILDALTEFFYEFNNNIKKNKLYRELFAFYVQREKFEYREDMHEEIFDFMVSLQTLMKEIKETGKLLPEILTITQETLKVSKESLEISKTSLSVSEESLDVSKKQLRLSESIKQELEEKPDKEGVIVREIHHLHYITPSMSPEEAEKIAEQKINEIEKREKPVELKEDKIIELKKSFEQQYNKLVQEEILNPEIRKQKSKLKKMDHRILVQASSPKVEGYLSHSREMRIIDKSIWETEFRKKIHLSFEFYISKMDFVKSILDYKPTILHFTGVSIAEIELLYAQGKEIPPTDIVVDKGLPELIGLFKDSIECVFLNTCYSAEQARDIAQYTNYAIGFTGDCTYRQSLLFVEGFYRAIGNGKSIPDAYKIGLALLKIANLKYECEPILFTNSRLQNKET